MAESNTTMSKSREAIDQQQSNDGAQPPPPPPPPPQPPRHLVERYNQQPQQYEDYPRQQYMGGQGGQVANTPPPPINLLVTPTVEESIHNNTVICFRITIAVYLGIRLFIEGFSILADMELYIKIIVGVDAILIIFTIIALKLMHKLMILIALIIRILDGFLFLIIRYYVSETVKEFEAGDNKAARTTIAGLVIFWLPIYLGTVWMMWKIWKQAAKAAKTMNNV